ncbi:MAG: PilN domain-containing protein [Pseudomonadota bacterium]
MTSASTAASKFWHWWSAELGGSLPKAMTASLTSSQTEQVVHWPLTPEANAPLPGAADRPNTVIIPASSAVQASATLPAAAEKTLYSVVGYELDRLTPFERGDAYYDCRTEERARDGQTIRVTIAAAPKSQIDAIIQQCAQQGISATRIDIGPGTGAGFNLLRAAQMQARRAKPKGLFMAASLAAAAVIVAGWASLERKDRALAHIEQDLTKRRASVNALSAQVNQSLTSDAARTALAHKQRAPLAIDLLNETTKLLPDDSFITAFRLFDSTLEIKGYSAEAAPLITAFDGSALLEEVTFTDPIMQDEQTGKQRFAMSMTVNQTQKEPAP